jgi:hypothetical protein
VGLQPGKGVTVGTSSFSTSVGDTAGSCIIGSRGTVPLTSADGKEEVGRLLTEHDFYSHANDFGVSFPPSMDVEVETKGYSYGKTVMLVRLENIGLTKRHLPHLPYSSPHLPIQARIYP